MNFWWNLTNDGLAEKIPVDQAENMIGEMISMLRKLHPAFSNELETDIRKRCDTIRFKKRAIIVDYGEICKHCYFATHGLVKSVYRRKGEDQTSWFMAEEDVIMIVESFYTQQPSQERMIALEDTDCIAMHWDDLQFIYNKHADFNRIGRMLTERYYMQAVERARWVGLKALERYEHFISQYPKFSGRVSDAAIASYLGINKSTLSRMLGEKYRKK